MKILFLGTSAGWPLPRLGCRCQICQSKDPKDKRWRPAVLVNDSVLIDAPPDIYHQLLKVNHLAPKIKALVLTHAHPDHLLGFYDLGHLYQREQKQIKLITTREVLNGLKQSSRYPLHPFIPEIVVANEVIQIDNLKVAFLSVHHNHTPTYAVKMKERKIFIYLPDLKRLPKNERKQFKEAHLLVLDGSSLGTKGQTRTHQSIEEGIRLGKELKVKHCYFTHIGHLTGPHQELEKFVQKHGGSNFHIAWDGLELEI
ncbi:MBL fold metallo-hydrolase [Candidatus Shapirobacteria bacterium]|nr:MBL fold metallo-hydrolase [Candidatus Shapirobacteria bacterium]